MPEMPLQAAAPGSYDTRRKRRGSGYARNNIDLGRSVMDRRAFLQSGSLAGAPGAAIPNGGLGPGAAPDMDELRKRVKRLVDICPAFESLADKREAMAKAAEQGGDKVLARDNYF